MVFLDLLQCSFGSKFTAHGWSLYPSAKLQIIDPKSRLINAGLSAIVVFYAGYAGAEILPTNTAETQVVTVNAVPVVDIAQPSSSGVSKNQFNDFDINSTGVVINNSLVDGASSLAGDLGANANFDNKSARIILNEVITTNTSDINGMTEIFGDDASYILSNPNGISCDGCGFIRTPTASGDSGNSLSEIMFTTGTATLDNGNSPLSITVGSNSAASIVIGAGGLDASNVDVTSLFTRTTHIQGVINAANQLRLLAGAGTLEIENNVAPEDRTLTTTQSDDGAVRVAIDATVAGAMHAGQIFIQATEDGVGVTLDNNLISTSGDIEITADGEIRYRNASASADITVSTNRAGSNIVASGDSTALGDITWNLSGDGVLDASGDIVFDAGEILDFNCIDPICQIVGESNIQLDADTLQTNATLATSIGRDIAINANLDTDVAITSGGRLLIHAKDGDINTRGLLQAAQDIALSSATDRRLILDGGVISGGDLGIFGDGTYLHDSIGLLDIGGDWVVDTFGLINDSTLTMTEFKDRTFFVKQLDNNGLIQSNSSLELHIDELLNNNGVITSLEGVIQIKHSQAGLLTTEVNNNGIISSTNLSQNQQPESSLIIDTQSLVDAHIAAILNGEQLGAQDMTDSIENANQQAIAELTVDTNILGAVEIHAQMLNNNSSGSITGSQILLDVGHVSNNGGLIVAGNNLSIIGDAVTNQNDIDQFGIIAAHDNIDIDLTDQLTNTGIIEASDVQIDAPTQINDNSGFVVDSLDGQTLDSKNFIDVIGQLAWFSTDADSGPYHQTVQVDGVESLVISDLSLLTNTFLTSVDADLSEAPIVGDDVYLAELIAHTIRDSGGLPFVTDDRSNLLQLGTLYDNTVVFMVQNGLAFGEMPTSQQLQQLEAPVVVFNQQTLANNQVVYSPKLIMPQTGFNDNRLQAQQLFTQIIAYNELLLRGERVTNSASLVGGSRLIIDTIDLAQTTTERNWYVDADGQVQYLSARIESPALVLSLSGDYVQEGGQIVSQGQVFLEARTVEVSGVEVNGRSATAEISTEDSLFILAQERASYGHDVSLSSGGHTVLQAGDELRFDGRLKAAGDISLQAEGEINLTAADIYSTSDTANLDLLAETGSIDVNDSRLKVAGDLGFLAAEDIHLSRSSLEASRHVEDEYGGHLILVSENGDITNDLGRLIGEESVYMMAAEDIVNHSQVGNTQDATISAGMGGVTQIAGNDIKNLGSEIRSEGVVYQQAEGEIRNETLTQTFVRQELVSVKRVGRSRRTSGREGRHESERRGGRGLSRRTTTKILTEYEFAVQMASISAGGKVIQQAGGDITNLGVRIGAGGDIIQQAGGDIQNLSLVTPNTNQSVITVKPVGSSRTKLKPARKKGEIPRNAPQARISVKQPLDVAIHAEVELFATELVAAGSIYSSAGGDFTNEGNLKADGDIVIAARDIINTRRMNQLKDSTSIKGNTGYSRKPIATTSGRQQVLDTGKLGAGGDIFLNAERDITDTAGRYKSGGGINLLAGRDINQNALSWQETENLSVAYTRKRGGGKSDDESTVTTYRRPIGYDKHNKAVSGSLAALGSVNIQADRDVNLVGSEIAATANIALSGRDITLQAIETGDKKYRRIGRTITRSKTVRHQVAKLNAGGSIAIQAEGDLTTYGSQINAGEDENGNIFINTKGETQFLGVNNEDYSFYQRTKKKSFGRRKTWISEDRKISLEQTALSGGGSLLVNLGVDANGELAGLESGKVILEGSAINMGADAMFYSADSLNVLSGIEYEFHRREQHKRGAFGVSASGSVSKEETQRLGHAEINTGGDTVLLSAGNINVVAGHLNAENIIAESGFGVEDEVARQASINILGDEEALATFEHQYKRGFKFSIDDKFFSIAEEKHNKNWEIEQNYIGSVLNARGDISLQTLGNIEITGSELVAGGNLALSANDIRILAARDFYMQKEEETISRIGIEIRADDDSVDAFAGLETTSIIDEYTRDAVHGSSLSAGNQIDIEASGSILQRSGELVAGNDVFLSAGENIEVEVEHTIENYNHEETTTRTGVSSSLTHNYESTKAAVENIGQGDNAISNASNALQAIDAVDSFVSGPSVSGFAGVTSTTTRTLDTISTAQNAGVYSGGNIQFISDNSLSLTGAWVSAENNINLSANDIVIRAAENVALQASDFRTTSYGLNLQANKNSGSVGLGGNFTDQDIDSVSSTIQASLLRSGASINLNALQDITVTASDIETGENLELVAGSNVYLGAQSSTSDYQLDARSGGAEFGVGYSSTSVGLYGSGHVGEEDLIRRGTEYRNSELSVGQQLTIRSGEDTTLEGVIAEANDVDLQIGGDLTLASLQDTGNVDGSRYDANLRVMGGAGVSVSGSVGTGTTEGVTAWVSQQTQLTGRESVSATVAGHTQLDGAVLAADNGNLLLDTNTLGFSNIDDIDREEADYLNVGFSLSGEQGSNPNQQLNNQATSLPLASGQQPDGSGGLGLTVSGYSSELDRAQINLATLGEGTVRVRQDDESGINSLENINRDVSIAQQVTRDNSENTTFYISDSSLNSLSGMFLFSDDDDNNPGERNTFVRWADDMGDYARSTYFTYRTMQKLGEIKSDSAIISAFSNAASLQIGAVDTMGTYTLGLFPGVENNGGLSGEIPALVLGDQIFQRVRANLIKDKNGKLVLDEENMQILGIVDRPEESDYVFTNGVQNDLKEAIQNGAMQTGAVEFIMAYNPEHGFLGDVIETGWDLHLGGLVASGNARQLRGFFQRGIKHNVSFNIAAHSQGGILTYRAMEGLDFSNEGNIDTGSLLFSGAPVESDDFYHMAIKSGFKVDVDLSKSYVLFQVNRPEEITSFFDYQMVDPVSDMPIFMGGNGTFIASLLSIPYLFPPLDKNSPHSNYLCQEVTCAGAGNYQPLLNSNRNKYPKPTILSPL